MEHVCIPVLITETGWTKCETLCAVYNLAPSDAVQCHAPVIDRNTKICFMTNARCAFKQSPTSRNASQLLAFIAMGFCPMFLLTVFGAIAHSLTSLTKTERLSSALVQAATASIFQTVKISLLSKSVKSITHFVSDLLCLVLPPPLRIH